MLRKNADINVIEKMPGPYNRKQTGVTESVTTLKTPIIIALIYFLIEEILLSKFLTHQSINLQLNLTADQTVDETQLHTF